MTQVKIIAGVLFGLTAISPAQAMHDSAYQPSKDAYFGTASVNRACNGGVFKLTPSMLAFKQQVLGYYRQK